MKYIKLHCDRYYCDTTFLVELKDNKINEYYVCPDCGAGLYVDCHYNGIDDVVELESSP